MNTTLRLLLLLTVLAWTTTRAAAIPGRAEVVKVVGTASVSNSGGSKPITVGMVLGTGDTINTGAASTVDLNLGLNGDFLRVDPDTTLKIDNLDIANVAQRTVTTQLNVGKGGITGNVVNKLTLASKYEIKSASGVAGIRGTVYSVKTDRAGVITRIVCTSGTVTFVDRGVTITISANQAYTPPPANTTPSQTLVGTPTADETRTVTAVGVLLQTIGATQSSNGTTTFINNPADVSTSIRQD